MSEINWGITQQPNAFQNAFSMGQQLGSQARANQERNALLQYASAPSMEGAAKTGDPRVVMQERQRSEEEAVRGIASRAASGDRTAMLELVGRDPQLWGKLDANQRERTKQATGFLGQAVLDVTRLPEPQRAQAWAQYVQRAEASGFDIPTQYEIYSPEALNAAAAEAGTMEKLIKQAEPDWRFSPNGGLVNFEDPASIKGYSEWMAKGGPGASPPPATLPPDFDFGAGGPAATPGTFR